MPLNLFQVQEGKRTGQQSQNMNNLEGYAEEWAPSQGQWGVSEESKQESDNLTWFVFSLYFLRKWNGTLDAENMLMVVINHFDKFPSSVSTFDSLFVEAVEFYSSVSTNLQGAHKMRLQQLFYRTE